MPGPFTPLIKGPKEKHFFQTKLSSSKKKIVHQFNVASAFERQEKSMAAKGQFLQTLMQNFLLSSERSFQANRPCKVEG
jgi:hypothetical protein